VAKRIYRRVLHNKRILILKPVLVAPIHDRDFIIMADAFDKTVAAILSHNDSLGVERNVANISRQLLPTQINYDITQRNVMQL